MTRDVAPVAHVADAGTYKGSSELTAVLDRLDALFGRYVIFGSDHARYAVCAWVVHTHCVDAFESTPRLALISPEKQSGKTRTLEVLELVVPNPLHTVNVSAAAMFRKIAEGACTLLLDEADTYLSARTADKHEDLRGLVNAGHRRGAVAYRCTIEKGVKVQEYPAFAPVALAGIGDLPDTILDRAVVVKMRRRAPGEYVASFRYRRASEEADPLKEALEGFAERHSEALEDLEPDMPAGITDRPADVWEPLVMIGDYAGPEWSQHLRAAATFLNRERQEKDPSLGVKLLDDLRHLFEHHDKLSTESIIEQLCKIDESPWGDLRGKPIDARGLSRRLRPYDVRPKDVRLGDVVVKGYEAGDLYEPWQRYLPPLTPQGCATGATSATARPADGIDTDAYEADYPDLFDTGAVS